MNIFVKFINMSISGFFKPSPAISKYLENVDSKADKNYPRFESYSIIYIFLEAYPT